MNNIPITQQQFLGASIRGFDINLGWGTEPTVLQVRLVEDDKLNEHFEYTLPGFLVRFQYNEWIFDGILNNYQISVGENGNRLIDVTITDPRQILDGVQLIIDKYNDGVYGVPNLYNVFGWLENIAYGYSNVNEFGIPAKKIIECLSTLMLQVPITFQGTPWFFVVDFTFLDDYYRISGDNISLLDFIDDICENYNRDYFIEAVGNVMYIRTIDRRFPSTLGAIGNFLNNSTDYNSATQGLELQKVTTSRFIVGGQVQEIYFRYNDFTVNDRESLTYEEFTENQYRNLFVDNVIYPYWGNDINGNAIIGQGLGYNHWMVLDGRSLQYPGFDFSSGYPSDTLEMIAASSSMDNWLYYLQTMDDPDESIKNLQFGKFSKMKMIPVSKKDLIKIWKSNPEISEKMTAKDFLNLTKGALPRPDAEEQDLIARVYKYVSTYANEYFGRKFMVRIPDVQAKFDPLTQSVQTSLQPVLSGYMSEQNENQAIASGLVPAFRDFVKDENGKITCYVRFSGLSTIDFSSLQEEDFLVQGDYLFVKAEIDLNLVFVDRQNVESPRAVITLPGPIYSKTDFLGRDLRDLQLEMLQPNSNQQKKTKKNRPGDNASFKYLGGLPLIPELAVIPLQNNYKTYGPWYNTFGGAGTCEFEKNEDLVPWNFGSFEAMNQAANSKIRDVGLNSAYGENGEITLPGAPNAQLGNPLVNGGPYVTNINVQFDASEGILTTYRMSRWATKIGKQTDQIINQQRKIRKAIADQKRSLRKLYKPQLPLGHDQGQFIPPEKTKIQQPQTPHHMVLSQVVDQGSGQTASVVSVPFSEAPIFFDPDNIEQVAGMSFDGLLRGFSTDPEASGIPRFTTPSENSGIANSITLNPFNSGDIGVIIHGKKNDDVDFNNDLISGKLIHGQDIRGLGLRSPLILVGWGYDINDKPVPNKTPDNPGNDFLSGYKIKQNEWKAGPLDCRWDEERGVWVAGGETTFYYFTTPGGMIVENGQSGRVRIQSNSGISLGSIQSGYIMDIHNLFPFWSLSGTKGICYKKGEIYHILQATCQSYPYY